MNPTTSNPERTNAAARIVYLPAPTAWPIVLAFGITLMFAGLVTSAPIGIVGAALAVTAGGGRSKRPARRGKEYSTRSRKAGGGTGPPPCPTATGDLSGLGGDQRRTGRRRGHGGARLPLWCYRARKHLVPDQSARRNGLLSVPHVGQRLPHGISSGKSSGRYRHPCPYLSAGWIALWGDVTNDFSPSNSSGRPGRSDSLDRIDTQHPGAHRSVTESADRLAVVRCIAGCVWCCGGAYSWPAGARGGWAVSAFLDACWF